MAVKYIFITGGVVSGLGKGITAASLGRLLKSRGFSVTMQKFDPCLNVDPGLMDPSEHGEIFVTDDGAQTDSDIGHFERFTDVSLGADSNVSAGRILRDVIAAEGRGEYGGKMLQIIPHVTDAVKSLFHRSQDPGEDLIDIIEIGGTVGDLENRPFLEAIRQFRHEAGRGNTVLVHVTLIPYLEASEELKTKPTQATVQELQQLGLRPDVIVCRCTRPLTGEVRDKIALCCNVDTEDIIENMTMDIPYQAPLAMEKEGLAESVCRHLDLPCPQPDLAGWEEMLRQWEAPGSPVTIALVGEYIRLHAAYVSVYEALRHAAYANGVQADVRWVDARMLNEQTAPELLGDAHGIIVPGGFGSPGVAGEQAAAAYAREKGIPFLGLCHGMQMAVVDFVCHVLGREDAEDAVRGPADTWRLGAWPCVLDEGSLSFRLYGKREISERHRHRCEINSAFRKDLQDGGMILAGLSPDGELVEMIELADHPFFIGSQAHPEFLSRPDRPHPLYRGFIEAAIQRRG